MVFNTAELAVYLKDRLIENAPVRVKKIPPVQGYSQYPGYLKQNAMHVKFLSDEHAVVTVGNETVPYAVYTERTSHKAGWIKKSVEEFKSMIRDKGGI